MQAPRNRFVFSRQNLRRFDDLSQRSCPSLPVLPGALSQRNWSAQSPRYNTLRHQNQIRVFVARFVFSWRWPGGCGGPHRDRHERAPARAWGRRQAAGRAHCQWQATVKIANVLITSAPHWRKRSESVSVTDGGCPAPASDSGWPAGGGGAACLESIVQVRVDDAAYGVCSHPLGDCGWCDSWFCEWYNTNMSRGRQCQLSVTAGTAFLRH